MSRYLFVAVISLYSSICAAEFEIARDLISLNYDFAPDRDDAHASAAARTLIGKYEFDALVVTGTVGKNRGQYIQSAGQLQDRIWGEGNHLNALENWALAVDRAARIWGSVIQDGGFVYVAEGGQSDFTADVIRKMREYEFSRLTNESVVVVQHSGWNENNTSNADLAFVKANTRYIRIDDGNGVNRTADLNRKSNNFVEWAKTSSNKQAWSAAFEFLDPNNKLDFSDTVELLHILGIGKNQISDPDSFARFIEGQPTSVPITTIVNSEFVENTILVEAESFVEADEGWTLLSNRPDTSGEYLKLLPDTRVTHSDQLRPGENFWGEPSGSSPKIQYLVNLPVAGEYRVSVRAFSTGSEDNSIHVGINGEWPATGKRMQWCSGKGKWTWSSAQRTADNHCGVDGAIKLIVESAGINAISFGAREDGFEFDSFKMELIQSNGTVLTDETIEVLSSERVQNQLLNQAVSRAEAVEAAFEECSNYSGSDITSCTKDVFEDLVGEQPSTALNTNTTGICTANGNTLAAARRKFAERCPMPVLDCDPSGNSWTCSSVQIGKAAPRRNRAANAAWYAANGGVPRLASSNDLASSPITKSSATSRLEDSDSEDGLLRTQQDTQPQVATAETNPDAFTGPRAWTDSYSVANQCFCSSSFDHQIGGKLLSTPAGDKTVREVCARVNELYGQGPRSGRVYFNTIQCGHGPTNNFYDELQCPGYPSNESNFTGPNCETTGATYNLESLYALEPVEEPADMVTNGNWWQPKGSENLSWFMQFNGTLNTNVDADVYFIDGDVDRSVVSGLKAQGKKVMCYISVGSSEDWRSDFSSFPSQIMGNDYAGWPGERWLDTTNLALIGPIMEARMDACAEKGFDGIDADNVNGHVNLTGFDLSRSDAITYVKWLANESHKRGMAFSLKNAEDIAASVVDDVDMLQSESCFVYGNCDAARVIRAADKPVWMVEYDSVSRNWDAACRSAIANGFSAIYRDVLLTGTGVYRQCR